MSRLVICGSLCGVLVTAGCGLSVVGLLTTADPAGGVDGGLAQPDGRASMDADGMDADAEDGGASVTCDASLASDPSHCGACGIDCLGGSCVNGRCTPVSIIVSSAKPRDLRLHDGALYWVEETGDVRRAMPDGGSPQVLVTGQGSFTIEVSSTSIYWVAEPPNSLRRVPLASPTNANVEDLTSGVRGGQMALAPDGKVFAARYSTSRVDRLDPSTNTWNALFLSVPSPWGVLVRRDTLIVGRTGDDNSTHRGPIQQFALDGGALANLVDSTDNAQCLAADDVYLYFSSWLSGKIYRVRFDLGPTQTPVELYSGLVQPLGVAIDKGLLYFTSGPNIFRAAVPP